MGSRDSEGLDDQRGVLEEIEAATKKKVAVKVDPGYHQEKFDILPG